MTPHPRAFLTASAVLTVLSLVSDVPADVAGSTPAMLMRTDRLANAIVVPAPA